VPAAAWQVPVQPSGGQAAGGQAYGGQASGLQYFPRASAAARLLAYLIDAAIIGAAVFVVMLLLALLLILLARGSSATAAVIGTVGYLVIAAAVIGYLVIFNGRGQTLGKKALKITVVNRDTGLPIGNAGAFRRVLMFAVMGMPAGLGYLSIPLTEECRGWHDKAANDVVVQLSAVQAGQPAR